MPSKEVDIIDSIGEFMLFFGVGFTEVMETPYVAFNALMGFRNDKQPKQPKEK